MEALFEQEFESMLIGLFLCVVSATELEFLESIVILTCKSREVNLQTRKNRVHPESNMAIYLHIQGVCKKIGLE